MAKKYAAPAAIALAWLATVAVADPRGNFPVLDDWSFAGAAWRLAAGELRLHHWTGMPLVVQLVWSLPWTWALGTSYEVLRLSTIALGAVGVLGCYGLIREVNTSRAVAAIAALTLGLGPLYLFLACSFMTDVPFVALAVSSLAAFARGVRLENRRWLWAAFALALAATGIRQIGLALPLAYGLALAAATRPLRWRHALAYALPALVTAACLWAYTRALAATTGVPGGFAMTTERIAETWANPRTGALLVACYAMEALLLAGLLSAPVAALAFARLRWQALVAGAVVSGLVAWQLVVAGLAAPFSNTDLYQRGVGVLIMQGWQHGQPDAPAVLVWLVTTVALISTGLLVVAAVRVARRGEAIGRAVLAAGVLMAPPLMLGGYSARYGLAFVPVAVALHVLALPASIPRGGFVMAGALTVLLSVFSVAAVSDSFALGRARWGMLVELEAAGLKPTEIDGGYDYKGARDYEEAGNWLRSRPVVIALAPVPGHTIEASRPVDGWLTDRTLYLLRWSDTP